MKEGSYHFLLIEEKCLKWRKSLIKIKMDFGWRLFCFMGF